MSTVPATPISVTVVVLAKSPVAGRVKTRCSPPCSPTQAAALAAAALADTLHTVERSSADHRTIALDGQPGDWIPDGFVVTAQCAGTLGERIDAAMSNAGGACVLIGMDTPQLAVDVLDDAIDRLRHGSASTVVGLSADGGFWLLGRSAPALTPGLCASVPMSVSTTGTTLCARLTDAGLTWDELDELTDVDDFATAVVVADLIPRSTFARTIRSIRTTLDLAEREAS